MNGAVLQLLLHAFQTWTGRTLPFYLQVFCD